MSHSIGINTLVLDPWGNAVVNKNSPLSKEKVLDWRDATRSLPSEANTNLPKVPQREAQSALDRLLGSLSHSGVGGDCGRLSLDNPGETDIQQIMSMVSSLNLGLFSNLCKSISQQMERATDVQTFLRDKRVAEYQQQIDKAVEQADKAKKAGIFTAVFDWIVGAVEVVYGALKVAEGVLTGDPLAIASGVAYLAAGTAGLVKAAAETAMLLGASKEKCQEVIDVAGKVQLGCECFAMAIDIFQAARAINAARTVTKGASEVLKSGASEALTDAIKRGASGEIEQLAEKFGKDVSQQVSRNISLNVMETEMVEVGNMTSAAAKQAAKAEIALVRNITKSFTHEGIEKLVGGVAKKLAQDAIKKGITLTAEQFSQQCVKAIMKKSVTTILKDIATSPLLIMQKCTAAAGQVNSGQLAIQSANLRKEIEKLILDQDFTQFMDEWVERNKQHQLKQLKDTSEAAQDTVTKLSDNIKQNSMLQTQIAGSLV
ncbi:type III secretion system translocon subunit SctE [Yersinia enterocolitica]|uniref:Secretion system effector SseC n=1 Tax=Yersinia enterocolitica subsp. palearctica serotype O:3 (strain DSM 13030 / CIP 106945 / Y11) TaxID=930944 RepID=A0A0H3P0U1_YERE1|nr:type III secretion system translocon subunit SctE [Yersinia enterocolitica]EHB22884.1 pathogenicity island 2 effector protein SseC [Yersinia enterocolitica subsp. palearctica PhRBD_Ye1]EKN3313045.1 type III secretion system translocon subunit SctE [Yersinia enterocolitica]EKN3317292.1 type III secretion system translocon subunit SctE [Yersinia enterocolitica]EKN3320335.1 type III secretion system translocon subunit SctE [Yersinia enterocolitica]EKN3332305.1 type III secretion system translo